jgi:cell division septal protein FtsQ
MQRKLSNKPQRKIKSIFILSLGFICFLLLLYFSSNWINSKPVKTVIVLGNEIIPTHEIINQIDTHSLSSNDFLLSIKSNVKTHPYVQNSIISHKQLDEIDIEVKEKKPLAMILNDLGEPFLIDRYNNILPLKNYKNCLSLPILRGIYDFGTLDTVVLSYFYQILDAINTKNEMVNYIISEIIYDKNINSFCLFSTDYGINIYLGNCNDLESKINKLNDLLTEKRNLINFSKLDYIDLRWKNLIAIHERHEQTI